LMESNTFGSQEASILLVASLAAGSVPTYLVKRGEPLASALAQPQVASLRSGR
jgi:hypothetical protein